MKKQTKIAALLIANAMVWASLMLTAADQSRDNALIAGWFTIHMLIVAFAGELRGAGAQWWCIRRKVRSLWPGGQ